MFANANLQLRQLEESDFDKGKRDQLDQPCLRDLLALTSEG